jgi:hypothetical protein
MRWLLVCALIAGACGGDDGGRARRDHDRDLGKAFEDALVAGKLPDCGDLMDLEKQVKHQHCIPEQDRRAIENQLEEFGITIVNAPLDTDDEVHDLDARCQDNANRLRDHATAQGCTNLTRIINP